MRSVKKTHESTCTCRHFWDWERLRSALLCCTHDKVRRQPLQM